MFCKPYPVPFLFHPLTSDSAKERELQSPILCLTHPQTLAKVSTSGILNTRPVSALNLRISSQRLSMARRLSETLGPLHLLSKTVQKTMIHSSLPPLQRSVLGLAPSA